VWKLIAFHIQYLDFLLYVSLHPALSHSYTATFKKESCVGYLLHGAVSEEDSDM